MDYERFVKIGKLLYGDRWKSALSRDLDCTRIYIVYMSSGDRGISRNIQIKLKNIILGRLRELEEILEDMENKNI